MILTPVLILNLKAEAGFQGTYAWLYPVFRALAGLDRPARAPLESWKFWFWFCNQQDSFTNMIEIDYFLKL